MTKKEIVVKAMEIVGAKEVEGIFEMTMEQFHQLDAELGNGELGTLSYAFCNNKKDENLKALYDGAKKNRYAVIRIVAAKPAKVKKAKAVKAAKNDTELGGVKGKYRFYLVQYKNKGEEAVELTNMNTCEQVKAFLKTVSKRKLEYLRIYSEGMEVRKSAWVQKEVNNEALA